MAQSEMQPSQTTRNGFHPRTLQDTADVPPGLPRDSPVESYWQVDRSDIADCRTTADLPSTADIAIIGSGISGASVAHHLLTADPSTKIVLLEARQAASGASGRNGGHTKTASYRSFTDNVKLVGVEDAIKVSNLEYDCMVAVHNFIRQHRIDCDSKRCDTVDVFYDQQQWQKAQESVSLMKKHMGDACPKHEFFDSEQTASQFFAPNSYGCLKYEAGSLNAYKFTIGVLKLALEKGLNLQTKTPVTSLRQVGSPSNQPSSWRVETPRGTVTASKVILATNGYTAHLLPEFQGVIVPFRGIVTAQRPGKSMPQTGLDTTYSFVYRDGYEYMISRPQGSKHEGDIVIGGGLGMGRGGDVQEFGNTNDTAIDKDIEKYLFNSTSRYFGDNWGEDHSEGRIRKTWSGVMGHSADAYPLVGPMPGKSGLYIDGSFQGHGMVLCFLCAKAVTQMILDQDGSDLQKWFPECYRMCEARLKRKFTGH